VIVRAFEQADKIEVQSKGTSDFVTNIDIRSAFKFYVLLKCCL